MKPLEPSRVEQQETEDGIKGMQFIEVEIEEDCNIKTCIYFCGVNKKKGR